VKGKTCVVTGANSGIGKAMAMELARRGAKVVLVCRSAEKGGAARAEIAKATSNDDVHLERADLSSLDEVRDLAKRLGRLERIDALLNNAGLYLPERLLSPDGFEMMFAVNHLAPFLLTNLLRERLAASSARVVTTSSGGHRLCLFDLENLHAERGFTPFGQYGLSKLANILFTREAARRLADDGINANCFHPGAVATGFAQDEPGLLNTFMKYGAMLLRSPEKGAETGIYLASDQDVADVTGEYFKDKKPIKPSRTARDDSAASDLWEVSARLVGLTQA